MQIALCLVIFCKELKILFLTRYAKSLFLITIKQRAKLILKLNDTKSILYFPYDIKTLFLITKMQRVFS